MSCSIVHSIKKPFPVSEGEGRVDESCLNTTFMISEDQQINGMKMKMPGEGCS